MNINNIFNKPKVKKEQERLLNILKELDPLSSEYANVQSRLTEFMKVETPNILSKDTVAIVACNLAGILIILNKEKTDVVCSKALGFIIKGRV